MNPTPTKIFNSLMKDKIGNGYIGTAEILQRLYNNSVNGTLLNIERDPQDEKIFSICRISDREQSLYNEVECWRNAATIYNKLIKLKPQIMSCRRKIKGETELNPHYWVEIKDAVYDCNLVGINGDVSFHYIIYKNKEDFYKRYGMKHYKIKNVTGIVKKYAVPGYCPPRRVIKK